jgi:hypothetical protein
MMNWRVYYGDGSTFSDADGSPFAAPRSNVQVIIERDARVGWRWISGYDYFVLDPERGGWRETNEFGLFDYLQRAGQPLVLFGRWLTDEEWHRLFTRVKSDLGPKDGWLVTEDRRDNP